MARWAVLLLTHEGRRVCTVRAFLALIASSLASTILIVSSVARELLHGIGWAISANITLLLRSTDTINSSSTVIALIALVCCIVEVCFDHAVVGAHESIRASDALACLCKSIRATVSTLQALCTSGSSSSCATPFSWLAHLTVVSEQV